MDDGSEPEPSYAYLLDKDKERLCIKDLNYCTLDEKGNPIPFCYEYPQDKRCFQNTIPPNLLFMGCYDDATCGGKPIGKIKIHSQDAPFAYKMDGTCVRSKELCDWITDEIAVPRCAKENNVAKCRDVTDNILIGCYTEETCGGHVAPKEVVHFDIVPQTINKSVKKPQTKKKQKTNKTPLLILFVVLVCLLIILVLSILLLFSMYQKKKKKHPSSSPSLRQKHQQKLHTHTKSKTMK